MWEKLKLEWKTFVWGVVATAVESYDLILAPFLATAPLVNPKYQWIVHVAVPIGFLILRKWRDAHVNDVD